MRCAADLTTAQRDAIVGNIQPTTGYLYRLSRRMQRRAWHPEDPVYKAAWRAHEAMVELLNALHSTATLHAWRPKEDAAPVPGISLDVTELREATGKKGPRNTIGNRAK